MRIDLPTEKEQARGAVVDRHDNRYQNTLAGSEYSTGWAENDMAGHIGKSRPMQIVRRRCPVRYSRQADIRPVLIRAVEMPYETHR